MPLGTAPQIQQAILSITEPPNNGFPSTQMDAVNAWADVADKLLAGVIPPSTTSAAGRAAFIGVLSAASPTNPIGAVLLDSAFVAYAAALAGGMAPLYVGAPPAMGLPGIAAILVAPVSDAQPVAVAMATALSIWVKTGIATMVAPPFTVLTWQ